MRTFTEDPYTAEHIATINEALADRGNQPLRRWEPMSVRSWVDTASRRARITRLHELDYSDRLHSFSATTYLPAWPDPDCAVEHTETWPFPDFEVIVAAIREQFTQVADGQATAALSDKDDIDLYAHLAAGAAMRALGHP